MNAMANLNISHQTTLQQYDSHPLPLRLLTHTHSNLTAHYFRVQHDISSAHLKTLSALETAPHLGTSTANHE
jgi:hypothetical protein